MFPGRWNERNRRVVYAATRIPLAILELMVQSSGLPLIGYVAYPFDAPNDVLETLDPAALSTTWRTALPGRAECRSHGETWRASATSAGLIVPSAVLPEAYDFGDVNVVLNPLHAGFARLTFEAAIPLEIDTRLQDLLTPPR